MSIELIAFCAGIILLLIAIIGGGIKIKEIEVPLLSKSGRILFALLGFFLLCWTTITTFKPSLPSNSAILITSSSEKVERSNEESSNASTEIEVLPAPPVKFSISDTLWPDQKQETIDLLLDEKYIGTIKISETKKVSSVYLKAPKEGTYEYRLTGKLIRKSKTDEEFQVLLSGGGSIEIFEGAKYHFIFLEESDPSRATISLVLPDAGANQLPQYKMK